jgi:hypothetical protein
MISEEAGISVAFQRSIIVMYAVLEVIEKRAMKIF